MARSTQVPAAADALPYPNKGTENPAVYVFTAQNTGDLSAYFYGSGASYAESLGLIVNTTDRGYGVFPDSAAGGPTAVGAQADFGTVQKGDLLTFYIHVTAIFNNTYNLFTNTATMSNVPLPGSAPMLGAALLGLAAVGYTAKRKKAAAAA